MAFIELAVNVENELIKGNIMESEKQYSRTTAKALEIYNKQVFEYKQRKQALAVQETMCIMAGSQMDEANK